MLVLWALRFVSSCFSPDPSSLVDWWSAAWRYWLILVCWIPKHPYLNNSNGYGRVPVSGGPISGVGVGMPPPFDLNALYQSLGGGQRLAHLCFLVALDN